MLSCGGNKKEMSPEEKALAQKSRSIDTGIKREKDQLAFKLLLLGTGDSGKSTFTKQMAFIYGSATSDFVNTFVSVLRDNCLDGMQTLLTAMEENGGIPDAIAEVAKIVKDATDLDPGTADHICTLWQNKAIQAAFAKSQNANIQGGVAGAKFYFDNAKRFAAPNFVPTKDDTLMARRKTVGIVETHFEYEKAMFTLVDVGGQRSERKKWLHCFNSVTAVIFLTAINEYDMVLEEDTSTNRLLESLKLWKALTSSQFFKGTPFILFLNKSDLFQEKIVKIPLGDIFSDFDQVAMSPEFASYNAFEKSWQYILKQFRSHFEGYTFYPHLTNSLDTELCRKVFAVVQETVIKETLKMSSLIT